MERGWLQAKGWIMRSHLMHALPACLPTTPTSWTLFFTPENVCLGCRALSADIQKFLRPKNYQRLRINSMSWSQLWWSSSLICCWNKQICRLCVWVAAVAGCQRNGTQSCLYWRYFGFHCLECQTLNLRKYLDDTNSANEESFALFLSRTLALHSSVPCSSLISQTNILYFKKAFSMRNGN